MAAMPRKDFPGRQCGFSTEATPPHSGFLLFQPAHLLLLIAHLAVGEAVPGKRNSKWSRCAPPYVPLPSPTLLLIIIINRFWSAGSEAASLGVNPGYTVALPGCDHGQVTSPLCAWIPYLYSSYG